MQDILYTIKYANNSCFALFVYNWVLNNTQIAKFMGANMGPTWVLSATDGPHVGPMNLAITIWFEVTTLELVQSYVGPNAIKIMPRYKDGQIRWIRPSTIIIGPTRNKAWQNRVEYNDIYDVWHITKGHITWFNLEFGLKYLIASIDIIIYRWYDFKTPQYSTDISKYYTLWKKYFTKRISCS